MNTLSLLSGLSDAGATVTLEAGNVVVRAARRFLTRDLGNALHERKAEVVAILHGDWCRATGELLIRHVLRHGLGADEFWGLEAQAIERAGIAQYEWGLDRTTADRVAYEELAEHLEGPAGAVLVTSAATLILVA